MQVRVRFFASLRERVGISEKLLTIDENTSIEQVWALLVPGEPLTENVLVARNMEYVKPDVVVKEGDEIAFFPPVTGGCL